VTALEVGDDSAALAARAQLAALRDVIDDSFLNAICQLAIAWATGRFDSAWLAAWSRVQLGTVAVLQGRLDQARELLNDALTLYRFKN
jgi:hypothetical protein